MPAIAVTNSVCAVPGALTCGGGFATVCRFQPTNRENSFRILGRTPVLKNRRAWRTWSKALPQALQELGHEVAVLLPRYHGNKIASIAGFERHAWRSATSCAFRRSPKARRSNGVRYFFVDDPAFFDRAQLYGDKSGDYPDNAERFAEFSRVAIEFTKRVWLPDVIHCHDWQSALVPVLLRTQHATDPVVRSLPVVLTIHNLGYQGLFPQTALRKIGLPDTLFTMDALEFYGKVNFLKGGLIFADYLTTVSRRYAKEIQTPEYGWGLEGVIRNRADRLVGILNGVDYARLESGNGHVDRAELFGAQSGAARRPARRILLATFQSAGGESGAAADRNRLAIRGPEGFRPDRARLRTS